MPRPPWSPVVGIDPVIERWLAHRTVRPNLAADKVFAPRVATPLPFPADLGPGLVRALGKRGIEQLYSHQAHAFGAAMRSQHFVVATPTASGKSLCFHLPVLETLSRNPDARAIYLYPTKALARDQEAGLRDLM